MRTRPVPIFVQESGIGVRLHYNKTEREDLFLCQCTNTLLCKKESRVGMLHSGAMPLNLITEYYTITRILGEIEQEKTIEGTCTNYNKID